MGNSAEVINPDSAGEIESKNKNIGTGLCKGPYNVRIKQANVSCPLWSEQSSVSAVPSPWLIEFEAIKMEIELKDGSKRNFSQFPLLAVAPSLKPSRIDFTVLTLVSEKCPSFERPSNPFVNKDEMIIEERREIPGTSARMLLGASRSSTSFSSSSSYQKIIITVQIKDNGREIHVQTPYEVEGKVQSNGKSQSQSHDGVSDTMLIREDLHSSLKLHLWPPQ